MQEKYIKSPLNYVGGKYKLLPQIIPLFPNNIHTFVDLFGGGFNVGINVNAEYIIYNDISMQVVWLLEYISNNNLDRVLGEIDGYIEKYSLTKENREGYLKLREDYNNGVQTPMKFYTLLCYAFNNQIRFNKSGEYNMPFGKDRSSFNPSLRNKFIDFHNALHEKNIDFWNRDFREWNFFENDFIYADPPYYNSTATYNENGGWAESDEKDLLHCLDVVNEHHGKFALSNNLKYNNPLLEEWKNKYNVHYLSGDYSNCNYQKKDKSKDIEVLITNY